MNYKDSLHSGPCTPCGKMTHKENLDQSQDLIIAREVWLWLLPKPQESYCIKQLLI